MKQFRLPKNHILLILLLLGIFGGYVIFYSTSWGPWVLSDSTAYINAARNLVAGNGFGHITPSGRLEYVSGHPPLLHLTLAGAGSLGIDMVSAARWLNIFLYGLTIFGLGFSIYLLSHSLTLSVLICTCIFTTPVLLDVFSGVMTEPQFLFFGIVGLFLLLFYFENNNWVLILSAAFAISLSVLARYPGFAFILAGVALILFFHKMNWRRRIKDVIYFLSASIIPTIIWLLWVYTRPHTSPPRQFSFQMSNLWNELAPLRLDMINVLWDWIPFSNYVEFSYRLKLFLFGLVAFCLVVLLVLTLRKIKSRGQDWRSNKLLRIASTFTFLFIAFFSIIVFFYAFLALKPGLIDRTLLLFQVAGVILIFSIIDFIGNVWSIKKYTQLFSLVLGVIIISSALPNSIDIVKTYHLKGGGYTGERWRSSGTITAIEKLPPQTPIITNDPDAILFLLERPAYEIEWTSFDKPVEMFSPFGDDENDAIQRLFKKEGAALVLFDGIYWQLYPFCAEETQQCLEKLTQGLKLQASHWDGDIYFYNSSGP